MAEPNEEWAVDPLRLEAARRLHNRWTYSNRAAQKLIKEALDILQDADLNWNAEEANLLRETRLNLYKALQVSEEAGTEKANDARIRNLSSYGIGIERYRK